MVQKVWGLYDGYKPEYPCDMARHYKVMGGSAVGALQSTQYLTAPYITARSGTFLIS